MLTPVACDGASFFAGQIKLKVEALTGIPPEDQTLTHQGQALDGRYRLTDFPAVHNRSTLVLADSNPRRNQVAAAQGAAAGATKMKANSVLSMSKMFQAGQIPGGSLSALQEKPVMFILFVLAPDGNRHAIEVMQSEFSIDTIQRKVEIATSIPCSDQLLQYGGRVLHPNKKLTSYGIQHCSEIQLALRDGMAGA